MNVQTRGRRPCYRFESRSPPALAVGKRVSLSSKPASAGGRDPTLVWPCLSPAEAGLKRWGASFPTAESRGLRFLRRRRRRRSTATAIVRSANTSSRREPPARPERREKRRCHPERGAVAGRVRRAFLPNPVRLSPFALLT